MDDDSLHMIGEAMSAVMTRSSGPDLDEALTELGWRDMLCEYPDAAAALVFRLMGQTGAHAAVINDVVLHSAGRELGGVVALPFADGSWVRWERATVSPGQTMDPDIPLVPTNPGDPVSMAAAQRALGWWLVGSATAMLELARRHALDREQFGKPIASFQAIRHRLAEAYVGIEGAEAVLNCATENPDADQSVLAKAIAGQAALTAARHCQQVLGGIGFTAEHPHHRHFKRVLVLDSLLGNSRQLIRDVGTRLRTAGTARPLVHLR